MIQPTNGHILIEPVKHDSFIATQRETYQEIGVVKGYDLSMPPEGFGVGDKVLFDAWLAKKYPKEGGDEYYWLVHLSDITAYEKQVSE